ncbi:MAG: calcium/sodium antiporter [Deferrisomatales bacterium]|nr:calcium/sodium antiporter [Deferrisomatales bacterium]
MMVAVGSVLLGTLLLYFGANLLIRGSSALARSFGVAPAIVGLTVVAFGTSLPELTVSVTAGLKGSAAIALGNVVGSNIANIGLVLGLAACIRSLQVEFTLVRREAPMGLLAVLLVVVLSLDGVLGRGDGVVLLAGFAAFLYWSLAVERSAPEAVQEAFDHSPPGGGHRLRHAAFTAAGLAGVLWGADRLVAGAVTIAETFGVPAVVIGLTLVAVGTSLPELAATLVAVSRGEDDISVGNVLGSNLFNLLLILGVTAVITPISVPTTFFRFQFPVLALYTVVLLPICRSGFRISRPEGGLLLAGYLGYVAVLYLVPAVQ